jgi:hypothetical protein
MSLGVEILTRTVNPSTSSIITSSPGFRVWVETACHISPRHCTSPSFFPALMTITVLHAGAEAFCIAGRRSPSASYCSCPKIQTSSEFNLSVFGETKTYLFGLPMLGSKKSFRGASFAAVLSTGKRWQNPIHSPRAENGSFLTTRFKGYHFRMLVATPVY